MRAIVFVGPTLRAADVASMIDGECRPPAAQGDVYRAALERPQLIGIIDGYFDGVPSVWHKEILWAMREGIRVFGSASMGALRAAELCSFGMRGVGRIFEDYRDGRVEDDDEVAVLHAPAELGFVALSEPMVSIRATLASAEAAGVITANARSVLVDAAKNLNYRERTWERILASSAAGDVGADQISRFGKWIPGGRVDAKREDALLMLRTMADEPDEEPPRASERAFEWTTVWESLTRRVHAEINTAETDVGLVLDEVRLDSERFETLRRSAALRQLALEEASRLGVDPCRSELLDAISKHRRQHGLLRLRELRAWLDEHGTGEREYERLARETVMAGAGAELPPDALTRHMVAELKWSGEFGRLRRRAREKAAVLAAAGCVAGSDAGLPPRDPGLVVWFFEHRLGEPVPDDLDGYARSMGLGTRGDLYRVLRREYLYSLRRNDADGDGSG